MDWTLLAVTIAAAVVPTIFYVTILVLLDRHEKEPWLLIALVFLWGAVPAVLVSFVGEVEISNYLKGHLPPEMVRLVNVVVNAPVVEEIAKGLALLIVFFLARKEFDGIMDGLLYGSLAGFGFAMTENFLYFQRAFAESIEQGIFLTFMRSVAFGMNHALFCSVFGLALGIARYGSNIITRLFVPVVGLAGAIALHMFHNYAVAAMKGSGPALSLVVMWFLSGMWLFLVFYALARESAWIREELAEEVENGLLTPSEVEATANVAVRTKLRLIAMMHRRDDYARILGHLYDLAAELAFKKRQYRIRRKAETAAIIDELRAEIRELKADVVVAAN